MHCYESSITLIKIIVYRHCVFEEKKEIMKIMGRRVVVLAGLLNTAITLIICFSSSFVYKIDLTFDMKQTTFNLDFFSLHDQDLS